MFLDIQGLKAKRDRLRAQSAQVNQDALNAIASTDAALQATAGLADKLKAIVEEMEDGQAL